jgi:hypothetical protein
LLNNELRDERDADNDHWDDRGVHLRNPRSGRGSPGAGPGREPLKNLPDDLCHNSTITASPVSQTASRCGYRLIVLTNRQFAVLALNVELIRSAA